MSVVRFATLCDTCGARSAEYTSWPACDDCLADTCPACQEPGSYRETDGATAESCRCRSCAAQEQDVTA